MERAVRANDRNQLQRSRGAPGACAAGVPRVRCKLNCIVRLRVFGFASTLESSLYATHAILHPGTHDLIRPVCRFVRRPHIVAILLALRTLPSFFPDAISADPEKE